MTTPAPSRPTLETLPPEIRRHLLCTLDLDALSALVHASPLFHEQYALDRRAILCRALQATLRSATPDACAVCRADVVGALKPGDDEWPAAVTAFLETWGRRAAWSLGYSIADENLTLAEAVSMAVFHRAVVRHVVGYATKWFLANLELEAGGLVDDGDDQHEALCTPLTPTEETRLLRGLYRLQLACIVFGNASRTKSPPRDWGYRLSLSTVAWLGQLEPWEIEEVGCVYAFAGAVYSPLLEIIEAETDPNGPRFVSEGRPADPSGGFDLCRDYIRSALHQGLISRGLRTLLSFLPGPPSSDHQLLLSSTQAAMCWPGSMTLHADLSEAGQDARRRRRARELAEQERPETTLPFPGELAEDPDGTGPPPLAWTVLWSGMRSDHYGASLPEGLAKWGYVMWDAWRVERSGAKGVLEREWKRRYPAGFDGWET